MDGTAGTQKAGRAGQERACRPGQPHPAQERRVQVTWHPECRGRGNLKHANLREGDLNIEKHQKCWAGTGSQAGSHAPGSLQGPGRGAGSGGGQGRHTNPTRRSSLGLPGVGPRGTQLLSTDSPHSMAINKYILHRTP